MPFVKMVVKSSENNNIVWILGADDQLNCELNTELSVTF